jgi:hypothetical protein
MQQSKPAKVAANAQHEKNVADWERRRDEVMRKKPEILRRAKALLK